MICLLELYPNQPDFHDYLARLGICESLADDGNSGAKWKSNIQITWTDKKQDYGKLLLDWPALVDSSKFDEPGD